jgi:predicted O-methyltransferase YrrM
MKTFSGRPWRQRVDELAAFIALLRGEGVRSYLEVGACHGDTFHAVVSSLPKGSRAVAIDMPEAAWGKPGSRRYLIAAAADLTRRGYDASIIFGSSRSAAAQQSAMIGGPYDAVLIDADHRYDGVLADWKAYGRMGRIVAFHDIDGEGLTKDRGRLVVEVPRLWRELRAKHQHREIIGEQRGMGIGVLWQ